MVCSPAEGPVDEGFLRELAEYARDVAREYRPDPPNRAAILLKSLGADGENYLDAIGRDDLIPKLRKERRKAFFLALAELRREWRERLRGIVSQGEIAFGDAVRVQGMFHGHCAALWVLGILHRFRVPVVSRARRHVAAIQQLVAAPVAAIGEGRATKQAVSPRQGQGKPQTS